MLKDDSAVEIAEALKANESLACLDIESNLISDGGIKMLSNALKINQSLDTLNINVIFLVM